MTIYNWLCLLGVPSVLAAAFALLKNQFKKVHTEQNSLKLGTQALLRNAMLEIYRACEKQGYADYEERESYEGLFKAYLGLNGNGIMKDLHNKFLALPTTEKGEQQ